MFHCLYDAKKGKRKVQGVPQSQTAALPRHQEEEETDKSKQAQIEQTYEKFQKYRWICLAYWNWNQSSQMLRT